MAYGRNYQQLFRVCWINTRRGGAFQENFSEKRGVPIGNITSQIFANIYLNELDWFIKRKLRVKNYFRYADDFVIVHPEKNYLERNFAADRKISER